MPGERAVSRVTRVLHHANIFKQRRPAGGAVGLRFVRDKHASGFGANTLEEVTITGNSLGTSDLIASSSQYLGDGLLMRSKPTLEETLDGTPGTPGASCAYFGPNASRPIIRGQDRDRILILNNSGGLLDVSWLRHDHFVSADPISIERFEVPRGAGGLQCGGSAAGGVVNATDNRIAEEAQFDSKEGVAGKLDSCFASGNRERVTSVLLQAGTDRDLPCMSMCFKARHLMWPYPLTLLAAKRLARLLPGLFAIHKAESMAVRWVALCCLPMLTCTHQPAFTAATTVRRPLTGRLT